MLEAIKWDRPWLSPYTGLVRPADIDDCASVADALNLAGTGPPRFVPQSALPAGKAYEQFIFETTAVPTRDNLHDFFNGLCWLRFPQTKKKLNRLQASEISAAGVQQLRGPVRDALTVFDENAAFLMAPQPLWDALVDKDWHRLFITLRPLWQEAQLVLFGHALLEKLVCPRKSVTAHVYRARPAINIGAESMGELDAWIAADLSADKLASKPFAPLPVLGVPGWWPENQNFSFYDDSQVFRPRR
jgi:Protein of unknown function (DUF3025)